MSLRANLVPLAAAEPAPPPVSLPASIESLTAVISPADAYAGVNFLSNGTWNTDGNPQSGNWYDPTTGGIGSNYEIIYEQVSGTTPSGDSVDVWLDLAVLKTWVVSYLSNTPGARGSVGIIRIRDKATEEVLASCPITLDAEVSI